MLEVCPCINVLNLGFDISPAAPCTNGEVRLSDGISNGQGRVEFCHNQIWGTICDSGWGIEDANVVCGQLGYVRGTKLEP